jgi:hypothetical protein
MNKSSYLVIVVYFCFASSSFFDYRIFFFVFDVFKTIKKGELA